MKHADNLSVARRHGSLLLQGHVHFVHDSVQFKTERASWNKNSEMVQCDGGFTFTHPSGYIKANSGLYQKRRSTASATGNVMAGDSAESYAFTGEYLVYDREAEILTMPDKPKLFQFEKQKDGNVDTVTIEARKIIYNKKESFAEAYRDVKVTQKDMVVTCDTGFFDRKNNWLSMKGHPTFDMKSYHLTGDSIFLVLDSTGKSMKSALVIRNAHGIQKEDAKKDKPGSVTEAFGDTLFCEFGDNKINRLYVNLNAKGFFYEDDLEEYKNQMDGDRLDLFFDKGKMDHAVVSGKAQSTYFYVKKDRSVSGKNEAAGDTINITFDPVKNAVRQLRLIGRSTLASGRYVDMEKLSRQVAAQEKSKKDSLAPVKVEVEPPADTSKMEQEKFKANKTMANEMPSKDRVKRMEQMREKFREAAKHKAEASKEGSGESVKKESPSKTESSNKTEGSSKTGTSEKATKNVGVRK
ncbi:MAG: hypothetical protein HUK21_07540 [Fibrobacteraceae bacterium]|nr:hypothetical protein [Fibrobacteraceae bacterium]